MQTTMGGANMRMMALHCHVDRNINVKQKQSVFMDCNLTSGTSPKSNNMYSVAMKQLIFKSSGNSMFIHKTRIQ